MEYIYENLVVHGLRTLEQIASRSPSKLVPTAVLLIIHKEKGIADVPAAYKDATIAALKAEGYDENGDLI